MPVRAQSRGTGGEVLEELGRRACLAIAGRQSPTKSGAMPVALSVVAGCERVSAQGLRGIGASTARGAVRRASAQGVPDGTVLGRQRIAANAVVALDIVSYASTGLAVGGLLCYPNDSQPHSTVIHVPGGLGGVFSVTIGDLVQTCINWAALHGRTAFMPSLRGNDGSEGQNELCLGEADDVVAAAVMVRSLDVTDPDRLGVLGGSIGACVTLRAAPRIPNLSAVVAFVPPTSWKDLVEFHRTRWAPATEEGCDGVPVEWTIGGTEMADALDSIICQHAQCSDEEYIARSPLPYVTAQSAPTLIVSAEKDNIVPVEQHLLWSLFRQSTGHPVNVILVDKCDPSGTPPLAMDVHVLALRANHLLGGGPISSGMLYLMAQLDRISP
jgi:alpha/beta superfamily hydrolase